MSQSLDEDIKKIGNAVKAYGNARLPEMMFVETFLPYFSGQRTPDEQSPIIETWLNISGGYERSVDLIGSDGKVSVTVPPLFINALTPTVNDKIDYSGLTKAINDSPKTLTDPTPYMEAIDNKLKEATMDTKEGFTEQWDKLFNHFGVEPIKESDTMANNDESDFLDYDD